MTAEEERAAAYLESKSRRATFEERRRLQLKGSEAARRRLSERWDALLPDRLREHGPARLAAAQRNAPPEDDGQEQWA